MHYIRFLKPPVLQVDHELGHLTCVVSLTTDLGDSFYAKDLDLEAVVLEHNLEHMHRKARVLLRWQGGTRAQRLSIAIPDVQGERLYSLVVAPAVAILADVRIRNERIVMPIIIAAHSAPIQARGDGMRAEKTLFRDVVLTRGKQINVWEETGDSTERHVWDAGMALVNVLAYASSGLIELPLLQKVFERSKQRPLKVIELGTGTGIVGTSLSLLMPSAEVLMTDKLEAADLARKNIASNLLQGDCKATFAPLDWDDSLPASISGQSFDLVVGADITYNPTSSSSLIKTICEIVDKSAGAVMLIAMKKRHPSEDIFFELMRSKGVNIVDQLHVNAPYSMEDIDVEESERIDVYTFVRAVKETS